MKRGLLFPALIAALAVAAPQASQAQRAADLPPASLRILRENAELVRHNATIYQWQRVNREVDRIVAAEKSVFRALNGEAGAERLRQTVSELRAARLNRDVERLVAAAQSVLEATERLDR